MVNLLKLIFKLLPGLAGISIIVQLANQELERVRGTAVPVSGAFGWMDSALLAAAGIPTVILGPDGEGAHADEEWVDLSSALATAEALSGIVRAFCG